MVIFFLVFIFFANPWINASIIIACAILHFVPLKFAYPSRALRLKGLTIFFTTIILLLIPIAVWFYPDVPDWLRALAVLVMVYFGGLAVFDTFRK